MKISRGTGALHRLLAERTLDLRALDTGGFRAWLDRHLPRLERDPVFVQRTRIRDLRRAHPRLRSLETEERRAAAADRESPHFERLHQAEHELSGAEKAVSGLGEALDREPPEKRAAMQRKLNAFRTRQRALREELKERVRFSPERQALVSVRAELRRLRAELGLDREEARLRELLRARGRGSGRRGADFEAAALSVAERYILPEVLDDLQNSSERQRVRVLQGVTLGAARMEIDQLLVRFSGDADVPVEVLALVEVKRNVNDLAHGLRLRQENLAWLTGDHVRYDAEAYRTASFPEGRFDRAVHESGGERYAFDAGSFRRFRPDSATGMILNGLYLVTRPGAIWGGSSAALARIAYRVSTDERWDPESEAYLRRLLEWCRSLTHALETPDVLRTYASTEGRARQIVMVEL